jgi:hypothetical protein
MPSRLFFLWMLLFIANGASAFTESIQPWVIHGQEHRERRVYFSPSCPACREAVTFFADKAAFVPVMKDENDFQAIVRMEEGLKQGLTLREAFDAAQEKRLASPISLFRKIFLHILLMRNKVDALRLGFDKLPLLLVEGMPRSPQTDAPISSIPGIRPPHDLSYLPPELNLEPLDQCAGNAPCPPPR